MKVTTNQVIAGALVVIASPIALLYAGAAFNQAKSDFDNSKTDIAVIAKAVPGWIEHPTCLPAMVWSEITGDAHDQITAIRNHCI